MSKGRFFQSFFAATGGVPAVRVPTLSRLLAAIAAVSLPAMVEAGIAYTNSSTFMNDATGTVSTVDFESGSAGDQIGDGDSFGGVTFNYSSLSLGTTLELTDFFETTSGVNSLGTDDVDDFYQLSDGDSITFTFGSPLAGFGLYLIGVADDQFDGDFTLSFGGTDSIFDVDAVEFTFGDGGTAWFLGVLFNDNSTFSSATLTADSGIGPGAFFFTIDDLQLVAPSSSAVPEPTSLALLLTGSGGAFSLRRRLRRPSK